MDDLFTDWFADCIFNEDHFLALGGDNKFINDGREIDWDDKSTRKTSCQASEDYEENFFLEESKRKSTKDW
jgi:hypothetical protein